MKQEELDRTFNEIEVVNSATDTAGGIVSILDGLFIENLIANESGDVEAPNVDIIANALKVVKAACKGMAAELSQLSIAMDKRAILTQEN